jgi:hypothetical protein
MNMVAYEFYSHDENDGDHLIGILPERRQDPQRITKESIMNWVKKLIGDQSMNTRNIFFVRLMIDANEHGIFSPK